MKDKLGRNIWLAGGLVWMVNFAMFHHLYELAMSLLSFVFVVVLYD